MASAIRVRFDPEPYEGSLDHDTPGGTLSFTAMGGGQTRADREQPKPAQLTFYAIYFETIRGDPKPAPIRFATLSGEIVLRRGRPLFRGARNGDGASRSIVYDEPVERSASGMPRTKPRRRHIRLSFAADSFEDVMDPDRQNARLYLPQPASERVRYVEIDTELFVDGGVEAPLGVSDRLDIKLAPLLEGPMFEWPLGLADHLPPGLLLTASEGGKSMTLPWERGKVVGDFRRFVFHRLDGVGPCSLVAKVGGRELTLLSEQTLGDRNAPIQWQHWLEELMVQPFAEEGGEPEFEQALPELVGRI